MSEFVKIIREKNVVSRSKGLRKIKGMVNMEQRKETGNRKRIEE